VAFGYSSTINYTAKREIPPKTVDARDSRRRFPLAILSRATHIPHGTLDQRSEIDIEGVRYPQKGLKIRNPKIPLDVAEARLGKPGTRCQARHGKALAQPFLAKKFGNADADFLTCLVF